MDILKLPYDGEVECYDPKEGVHVIMQELSKAQTITQGSGKHKRSYYDVIASFDIETSKVEDENWTKDMPECYHYFNYTYCWQFMINGRFIFGREASEFFRMLDMVQSKKRDEKKFCIFIHNIAFEYGNLTDFFVQKRAEAFFKNPATPLYIRRGCAEFRCTAQLTHKSLAQLGAEVGVEKLKSDFDYNVPRAPHTDLTPLEMNYCYRDVLILDKWLRRETDNYCKMNNMVVNPANLPYTQTGYVRRDIRRAFSDSSHGHIVLNDSKLTQKEYEFLANAFWGAFTHANPEHICEEIEKPLHYDITSAYPSVMVSKKFPNKLTGTRLSTEAYLKGVADENTAIVAQVVFRNIYIKPGMTPFIPYAKIGKDNMGVVEENGKIICANWFTIVCTDVDFRLIQQAYDFNYDDIEIKSCYIGTKKPLPYTVVRTILEYFRKKTTLKGVEGADYEYLLAKQMLNGIYGLSATALEHFIYELNGLIVEKGETEYKEARVLPYQWALYITAYVREIIYGTITNMKDPSDFYYSDTDSIFCRNTPEIVAQIETYNEQVKANLEHLSLKYFDIMPKNPKGETQYLGTLALEDDDIAKFATCGAKRYYIVHSDGLIDVTMSGLRATKITKDEYGVKHNGYNTQRLLDMYGSMLEALNNIRDSFVELPYVEGVDKLSNYHVIYDFSGTLCGREVHRPCTYTLYPMGIRLSLNGSLREYLTGHTVIDGVEYEKM